MNKARTLRRGPRTIGRRRLGNALLGTADWAPDNWAPWTIGRRDNWVPGVGDYANRYIVKYLRERRTTPTATSSSICASVSDYTNRDTRASANTPTATLLLLPALCLVCLLILLCDGTLLTFYLKLHCYVFYHGVVLKKIIIIKKKIFKK